MRFFVQYRDNIVNFSCEFFTILHGHSMKHIFNNGLELRVSTSNVLIALQALNIVSIVTNNLKLYSEYHSQLGKKLLPNR